MTITDTRLRITTKRQLSGWLNANGITYTRLQQKDGAVHFVPVLPPSIAGAHTVFRATISLDRSRPGLKSEGWSHNGTKYASGAGTHVDLTADEIVVQDAYVARLNEIQTLLDETRNVYMHLR